MTYNSPGAKALKSVCDAVAERDSDARVPLLPRSWRFMSQHNIAQVCENPRPALVPYRVYGPTGYFFGYVHALSIDMALDLARDWQGPTVTVRY